MKYDRVTASKLIRAYLRKKSNHTKFRHAIATELCRLKNMSVLELMLDKLGIRLAEITYINEAKAIKTAELLYSEYDYGYIAGVGAEVNSKGGNKKTIGRFFMWLIQQYRRLVAEKKSAEQKYDHLHGDVVALFRGKADIVTCPECKGTGKGIDDNEEICVCWTCHGNKKIIQHRPEKVTKKKKQRRNRN